MAHLVRLRNKYIGLSLILLFISCTNEVKESNYYPMDNTTIKTKNGITTLNQQPLDGIVFQLYEDGDTQFIQAYKEGKKHGEWKKFYKNKQLAERRYYQEGLKEGLFEAYWPSGNKKIKYHFKKDLYHGNNKGWLDDGTKVQDMNYNNGKEIGLQKTWYPNGQLKSNYLVKNGRRYGLYGTKNCNNVSSKDSIK